MGKRRRRRDDEHDELEVLNPATGRPFDNVRSAGSLIRYLIAHWSELQPVIAGARLIATGPTSDERLDGVSAVALGIKPFVKELLAQDDDGLFGAEEAQIVMTEGEQFATAQGLAPADWWTIIQTILEIVEWLRKFLEKK